MNAIKPVSIERHTNKDASSDFALLRQEGIDLIQKLSGKTWTDYNLHDPGVTILEQLCFAITDLAYRTDFPIEDILCDKYGEIARADHAFFNKELILTTNPVTVNDFRKVILDEVSDIDNVWLEPVTSHYSPAYIKGLYVIVIQVNKAVAQQILQNKAKEEDVINAVRKSFLSTRNLGEDHVRHLVLLEPQTITVQSDVIIRDHTIPEDILAQIYCKLEAVLNPPVNRYTEKELLDKGYTIDQVYSGPLLSKGIIPDSELRARRREIDPSELIKAISQVDGVLYVRNLWINGQDHSAGNPFVLQDNHFPLLDLNLSDPSIKLFNNEYEIETKKVVFKNAYSKLQTVSARFIDTAPKIADTRRIVSGKYNNIIQYHSLQNYFPTVYGIGMDGLSSRETNSRKAKARQLKAYLLFFEQVLANYLAQLANVGNLFTPYLNNENTHTYFFQDIYDVPGVNDILLPPSSIRNQDKKQAWEEFKQHDGNRYMQVLKSAQESNSEFRDRKSKIMDHLLARFNKQLLKYPVVLYNTLYGDKDSDKRVDLVLSWKANVLKNVVDMDRDRVKSFDYTRRSETGSGFKRKMAMMLMLHNDELKRLTGVFDTGSMALVSEKERKSFAKKDVAESYKEVTWDSETLDIYIGSDEIIQMSEMGELIAGGIDQDNAYVFRHQGMSVLRHGINTDNYRIGPDISDSHAYVIIYKAPSDAKWRTISRHPDKYAASKSLVRLIRFLKKLSIESEGFHLLEHVLLRPELNTESFGFKFNRAHKDVLLENESWTSFEGREKAIAEIIRHAINDGAVPANAAPTGLKYRLYNNDAPAKYQLINTADPGSMSAVPDHEAQSLKAHIQSYRKEKTRFYPNFEMQVKMGDGTVVNEDLYNFRMTVVLPAWPARFQDKDFRQFTEEFFQSNAPAHMRIHFLWLDVANMKLFESLYFNWLDMFHRNAPYAERHPASEKLTAFLINRDIL